MSTQIDTLISPRQNAVILSDISSTGCLRTDKENAMPHVALLGDSILDNGAYVSGGPAVTEQLQTRLPRDWRVTLLAQDGADSQGVIRQLKQLPNDATHLIFTGGGNDALECTPILNSPASTPALMLSELAEAQDQFRINYQEMIRAIRQTGLPAIGCTIYDAIPDLRPTERMALSLFNDMIIRTLSAAHIPVLDLRSVLNEAKDYSSLSPIEPSEIGGSKIARALQYILSGHDFSRSETIMYP